MIPQIEPFTKVVKYFSGLRNYLPGWSVPMIMQVGRLERSGTFAQQSVEWGSIVSRFGRPKQQNFC